MRSAFLFLGIIVLAGFSAYWAMGNLPINDNFTNFVGSVSLSSDLNSEKKQILEINVKNSAKEDSQKQEKQKISVKKSKKPRVSQEPRLAEIKTENKIIEEKKILSGEKFVAASSVETTATVFIATSVMMSPAASTSLPVIVQSVDPPVFRAKNIVISEILAGIDANADYEFIELYNPTQNIIDLTGWSIKKRNSKNNEETLVTAKKFQEKKIAPNKYLLLANEGGYNGNIQADILWPKSYSLAYANNAIILYNNEGKAIEDIGWDKIEKGQSLERVSWASGEFKIQPNPNPQNNLE